MMRGSLALVGATFAVVAYAQTSAGDPWDSPRRGSWVREGAAQKGDVTLWKGSSGMLRIFLPKNAPSNLRKAAEFHGIDLVKLGADSAGTGAEMQAHGARILVRIAPNAAKPESYTIQTDAKGVVIEGTDAHGAAFGLYELSERLGVDPLHHWTGFTPKKRDTLVMKATRYAQGSPAVRWRGLFHDDEDILPRPFRADGTPHGQGTIPKVWYERWFETALRLRMNMVAPWVRVTKPFEIQKTASDWGLAYTSHHYDTLLSDPFHFNKGLALKRGVEPKWDWLGNREGILKFWRGGVEENKDLDAIYPIGLRGTEDHGYNWPNEWSQDRILQEYNEAFALQARMVDEGLPKGRPRLTHFTMYTEMLPHYQTGKLKVPEGTIVVWPDDNDGNMRGLPAKGAPGKHGVYYHLAYYGRNITKQTHQTVPLERIATEFRKIFDAGATEYVMTNVSELREYVMGTRFINDLMWSGTAAYRQPEPDRRFLAWWTREYFGENAADEASAAIDAYFDRVAEAANLLYAAEKILGAIPSLRQKLAGDYFAPARQETVDTIRERYGKALAAEARVSAARTKIADPEMRRFFDENVALPAAIDRLNTEAASILLEAMQAPGRDRTRELVRKAAEPLDKLDTLLRAAERPPFEAWYGPTWISYRTRTLVTPRRELRALLAETR